MLNPGVRSQIIFRQLPSPHRMALQNFEVSEASVSHSIDDETDKGVEKDVFHLAFFTFFGLIGGGKRGNLYLRFGVGRVCFLVWGAAVFGVRAYFGPLA